MQQQVIIIGGGLAGLCSALHLAKAGHSVTVVEKHQYPKHKVCGEYVSNEVLPYLKWLGADVSELNPVAISKAHFSTATGDSVLCGLPMGGFGISRFAFDEFLYKKALERGVSFIFSTVEEVRFSNDSFEVTLSDNAKLQASVVLGAYGKRSNLDKKFDRKFISHTSPWLAVKCHYKGYFAADTVGLHNFEGGYCGVSKVEDGNINVCYLVSFESFKRFKNVDDFEQSVLMQNPELASVLTSGKRVFDQPLTISQINFEDKPAVENHILMIGDAAGLIHPLCGNGMAMAIHSAKMASECIIASSQNRLDRQLLEKEYTLLWHTNFNRRLKTGRLLSRALLNPSAAKLLLGMVKRFPSLLPRIIKFTHGKPIDVAA
ncbi:NAD(P)/FAD-dependent oxidoreductase [Flavobacterium silvaticum]|uniref:NAD(P)/FAD-dependent oxidoreductase n=1 Tax=Flavobacterium silvaticum TaxID=1852020 RepID=A0A972FTB7_9FLAO|nr:NAD(P)/FAD-dependent oxidoreductase [Flavobacterium silvaticum]NMH28984.1 NAD(P)/FAD-dependent oxidoreductase [Flavobacterium silvaticum]